MLFKVSFVATLCWYLFLVAVAGVSAAVLNFVGGSDLLWVILVWVPFFGGICLVVVHIVITTLTQTNAYPPTMDFLRRVRDRLQPQFENKLMVRYTGHHELIEERWVGSRKEIRVLVLVPYTDGGDLKQVEVKEESIKTVVEEEIARPKPVWVVA